MSNKTNNTIFYIIGIALLLCGISVILSLFHISVSTIILPIIGLFLISFKKGKKIYLYLGTFILTLGIVVFLVFNTLVPLNFLISGIVMSIAISLFVIYLNNKKLWSLIVSLLLFFLPIRYIMIYFVDKPLFDGYSLLLLGVFFVLLFILEYKRLRFLPIIFAIISYASGFLNLAVSLNFISEIIYKTILSTLFIICGIIILYIKSKNVKADDDYE